MASAGWYPDPDGTPGRVRYWDGQGWTQRTATPPERGRTSPPLPGRGFDQQRLGGRSRGDSAGSAGQPPPGFSTQPEFTPQPAPTRPRTGVLVVLGLVALLVFGLATWLLLGRGLVGGSPATSAPAAPTAAAEPEQPTAAPEPEQPTATADGGIPLGTCAQRDGTPQAPSGDDPDMIYGGQLATAMIDGWSAVTQPFHIGDPGQSIMTPVNDSWMATVGLGKVYHSDGFSELQQSAELVTGCLVSDPSFYVMVSGSVLLSEATLVDGHDAHHIRFEVRVDPATSGGLPGDVVDVVLVDSGADDGFSYFFGAAPIDSELRAAIDQTRAGLRVIG